MAKTNNQHLHEQKPTLEDYIFDMETRPPDRHDKSALSEQDLYERLKKKEADLLLAAELGKALLEKNDELTKQQESMVEEYSKKIELLEQERHVLRRRLSVAESEGDVRVLELESDYNDLKMKLATQESTIRLNERDKNALLEELTSQNARLTAQIQLCNETEVQLTNQLQEIKDQYCMRNSSLQDHVNGLESLKDELRMLARNKGDLEKRLQSSLMEKDTLSSALEEALDRIHTLERFIKEQETKLQTTSNNLDRIQRENNTLSERLESGSSSNHSADHSSLLHEMECDEDLSEARYSVDATNSIVKEARSVYNQLKLLYATLKNNSHDGDSGLHSDLFLGTSSDDPLSSTQLSTSSDLMTIPPTPVDEIRPGMLASITDDVIRLIMGLDLDDVKNILDQSKSNMVEQEEELRRRQDVINDLECKLSVNEIEIQSAIEERDRARKDVSESSMAQDEVVTKARDDRDAAIQRRTKAEIELAKTRVELMQANSELLEAIQQKVELSQQVEQLQMDMYELIEENIKKQLDDTNRPGPITITVPKKKRLFSLFLR